MDSEKIGFVNAPITDQHLTTVDCAKTLKVTSEFIRGEINAGRLEARVLHRTSGRSVYRIKESAFSAYVERYWPECSTRNTSQPSQRT